MSAEPPAAQRARGDLMLSARRRGAASVIDGLSMAGSSKFLFPYRHGADRLDAVWLNTAGGITGGDRFSLDVTCREAASLRLSSQAAERVYKARPGPVGRVAATVTLEPGAEALWLPQETILFDGAALERSLQVEMARDARFLGVETLVFGRAAMGERVRSLRLSDRIDIRREGRLVWADRLRLDGDAEAALANAFVGGGAGAVATLVCARP
ncbi:urease accessory protein UreD, partial [Litorisediminicola beolgyonensis]